MSHPLIPAKPTKITLETLPELFAHHRAWAGGMVMEEGSGGTGNAGGAGSGAGEQNQAPERPDSVTEDEWAALGDPGKRAIVRERSRADTAERNLAAARQRPAPPKPQNNNGGQGGNGQQQAPAGGEQTDFAALIKQAVDEAVKPFHESEQRRETQKAVAKVQQDVIDVAKVRLHDASDALTNIDLTTIVDDKGVADPEKLKTAIDDLVTRKPHLAKTQQRIAPIGIGGGAPATSTEGEKVKAALADMQRATGVRPAASSGTN